MKMKTYIIPEGKTIHQGLNDIEDLSFNAPCGGKGTCGKCKVRVLSGELSPLTEAEEKFLTREELDEGYRLACRAETLNEVTVELSGDPSGVIIAADLIETPDDFDPLFKREEFELEKPHLEDQRSDLTRLLHAVSKTELKRIPIGQLASLPSELREAGYKIFVVHDEKDILNIKNGKTHVPCYGVAVDIGTTTVVSYLIDTDTGEIVDLVSGLNEQGSFGADVISRIHHANSKENGLSELHGKITGQLNRMMGELTSRNGLGKEDIYGIVLVGNTTMVHLLADLSPEYIAAAPFIPVTTDAIECEAGDIGLEIHKHGKAYILPSIAAYVGADIVAGILASGMAEKDELSLLIDIGTNGEIALGNRDHIISCSVAAGPAFEGAEIRFGIGGIAGAINSFSIGENGIEHTTIMDKEAIGICGSGIVDILSELLRAGLVDDSGRFREKDELATEAARKLASNVVEFEGFTSFKITDSLLFTQKDIREIQNAKAALAAGIITLTKNLGKTIGDIEKVYLAGGFGSYINQKSAVGIGLLPREVEDVVEVIGNGAGKGAILSLLSRKTYEKAKSICEKVEYIELSSSKEFNEAYINNMFLPKF